MRVAVFRAFVDGRRTATRLADLGHQAVLAPVLRIVPTGATVRAGDGDGLVFTSAHAPEALAGQPGGTAPIRHLPCWCVGVRTAAAARAAGFTRVVAGSGTAAALSEAILADLGSARLTLVAGRDRKPDLERHLVRAGATLRIVEAYDAQAVPFWPKGTVDSLSECAAALHYSRRSAELARRLAGSAGLGEAFHGWSHCCLSADVAAGLGPEGLIIAVADKPDEISLLTLVQARPEP